MASFFNGLGFNGRASGASGVLQQPKIAKGTSASSMSSSALDGYGESTATQKGSKQKGQIQLSATELAAQDAAEEAEQEAYRALYDSATTFDSTKTYNVGDLVSWSSPVDGNINTYKLIAPGTPAGTLPSDTNAWKFMRRPRPIKVKRGDLIMPKKSKSALSIPERIEKLKTRKVGLTTSIINIDKDITNLQATADKEAADLQAAADKQAANIAAAKLAKETANDKAITNAKVAANAIGSINAVGGRRKSIRKNKRKGKKTQRR